MELLNRLLSEWKETACGITIDIVGDSNLSSELQWVLAFPVVKNDVEVAVSNIDSLRADLHSKGFQPVESLHLEPTAKLPNGLAVEPVCPYRPDSCLGEHIIASGHGLISAAVMTEPQATDHISENLENN